MSLLTTKELLTTNNICRTASLFYETKREGDIPIFTLSPSPPPGAAGLIQFRPIYLSYCVEDPTEMSLAEGVFVDWSYWDKISKTPRLVPYIEELRKVAAIKRKELAFKAVIQEAKDGKSRFTAAKYLIEEPWKGNSRSVKKQIQETSIEAANLVNEDIERLREAGLIN